MKRSNLVKIVTAILILAGLGIGGYFVYTNVKASQAATTNTSLLQTTEATKGNLVLYANGTGTIAPMAESSIGFNASGQVTEILVKVGDNVEAGQVLAWLDDTDARIVRDEAQQAMNALTSASAVATAKQTLADAQIEFAAAKESLEFLISPEVLYWEERVAEREQTLADAQTAIQTDTSDAAKQKVTDAETSLKYAQAELKYFQTVYEESYIPENFTEYRTMNFRGMTITQVVQVEDPDTGEMVDKINAPSEGEIGMARSAYELAKATIAEAQTYLDVLNGKEIPEGATGASLVTYIKTKHALQTAEYNLQATIMTAPINGTVTSIDMNVGDLVGSDAVVTISNLDQPYILDAYLDAEDWGAVKVGYEVQVSFDILPDQVFDGKVTNVYPTLDTTSSNTELIHITAVLSDTISYELPAGSAASVDVIGGRAENAVLVPVEALHEIDGGQYTLFVMQDGTLRLRVVEVGLQDLTQAQIIAGVEAGETVTTGVVETR